MLRMVGKLLYASMVELADTQDLKSCGAIHEGSNPSTRTIHAGLTQLGRVPSLHDGSRRLRIRNRRRKQIWECIQV